MNIKYVDLTEFYGSKESFIGIKLFNTVFQNIDVLALGQSQYRK